MRAITRMLAEKVCREGEASMGMLRCRGMLLSAASGVTLNGEAWERVMSRPTALEVELATTPKVGRNTAPGPSGVDRLLLSLLSPVWRGVLNKLVAALLRCGASKSVKEALVVTIPKRGASRDIADLRPITLAESVLKAATWVVSKRLEVEADLVGALSDVQFGFRRQRSTGDAVQLLLAAAEMSVRYVFVCLIDISAAYDSVPHGVVRESLRRLGASESVCSRLLSLVCGGRNRVRAVQGVGPAFEVGRGLRQGDCLSPLLFDLVVDPVLSLENVRGGGVGVDERELVKASVVGYADDFVVLAQSRQALESAVQRVASSLASLGLSLSFAKCVAARVDGHHDDMGPPLPAPLSVVSVDRASMSEVHGSVAFVDPCADASLRYLGCPLAPSWHANAVIGRLVGVVVGLSRALLERRASPAAVMAHLSTTVVATACFQLEHAGVGLIELRPLDRVFLDAARQAAGIGRSASTWWAVAPLDRGGLGACLPSVAIVCAQVRVVLRGALSVSATVRAASAARLRLLMSESKRTSESGRRRRGFDAKALPLVNLSSVLAQVGFCLVLAGDELNARSAVDDLFGPSRDVDEVVEHDGRGEGASLCFVASSWVGGEVETTSKVVCGVVVCSAGALLNATDSEGAQRLVRRCGALRALRTWGPPGASAADAELCAVVLALWVGRLVPRLRVIGLSHGVARRVGAVLSAIASCGRLVGSSWVKGSAWRAVDALALLAIERAACHGVVGVDLAEMAPERSATMVKSGLVAACRTRLGSGYVDALSGLPVVERDGARVVRLAPWRLVALAARDVVVDGNVSAVLLATLHGRVADDAPQCDGVLARAGRWDVGGVPSIVDPLLAPHHAWMVRARCGRLSSPELASRLCGRRRGGECPLCEGKVGSAEHGVVMCSAMEQKRVLALRRLEATRQSLLARGERHVPPAQVAARCGGEGGAWVPWLPSLAAIVFPRRLVVMDRQGVMVFADGAGGTAVMSGRVTCASLWWVVLVLPPTATQLVVVASLLDGDVVVLPWHLSSAVRRWDVVCVVAAGCWPAWPASSSVAAPSVVPRSEARLHVSSLACGAGEWSPCAVCVCACRGALDSRGVAVSLSLGGLRGGLAAVVQPDPVDLRCEVGVPEGCGPLAASASELWALMCGLARKASLDRWLGSDVTGASRELLARLLLRACIHEGRMMWTLFVNECLRVGVGCGLEGEGADGT
jgi:hypothetical protein